MGQPPAAAGSRPARTWRPMALWSAALLAGLGLLWLVAGVALPFWQTRKTVSGVQQDFEHIAKMGGAVNSADEDELLGKSVQELGGPRAAAGRLQRYLRMSERLAPNKHCAVALLSRCEGHGIGAMSEALANPDVLCRRWAGRYLAEIGPAAAPAVPALVKALKDGDASVRSHAAYALGRIGPQAGEAIPALVRLIEDPNEPATDIAWVYRHPQFDACTARRNAVWALGQIDTQAATVLPVLEKALGHRDESVQGAAIEAVEALGAKAGILAPAVKRFLGDDNPFVRLPAARIYWRLTVNPKDPLDCALGLLKTGDQRETISRDSLNLVTEICGTSNQLDGLESTLDALADIAKRLQSSHHESVPAAAATALESIRKVRGQPPPKKD